MWGWEVRSRHSYHHSKGPWEARQSYSRASERVLGREKPLTVLEVGGAEGLVSDTISWMASRSFSRCRALLMPISRWISVSDRADMMAPLLTLARQAATYQAGIPTQSYRHRHGVTQPPLQELGNPQGKARPSHGLRRADVERTIIKRVSLRSGNSGPGGGRDSQLCPGTSSQGWPQWSMPVGPMAQWCLPPLAIKVTAMC